MAGMIDSNMQAALEQARTSVDTLKKALIDVLVSRQVYRIPWGSGVYLRVPKDLHDLKASDVLVLTDVVNKLTRFAPEPAATEQATAMDPTLPEGGE